MAVSDINLEKARETVGQISSLGGQALAIGGNVAEFIGAEAMVEQTAGAFGGRTFGNVTTGDHQLEVLVDGKLEGGADFSRTERFTFRKEVKPKMVELTLAGSGNTPIAMGEW